MARRAGISQEELRRANVSALLTWVHAHGPTSRAVLTTELGLNRSTIGDLTVAARGARLVSEEPAGGRAGASGRPSLVVTACPERDAWWRSPSTSTASRWRSSVWAGSSSSDAIGSTSAGSTTSSTSWRRSRSWSAR